jgi:uncharacterized membrane protein
MPVHKTRHTKATLLRSLAVCAIALGGILPASYEAAQAGSWGGISPKTGQARSAPARTTSKGDPNPVARDHRGDKPKGGGVSVGDPRPGGGLCAGWFC